MDMPEEEKAGIPAWVMTFADLMSLLMCFFVLLLSFAEMDATKFKQIAESMEKAFGVQRKVPAVDIPMGTSPIFDKFSPGVPQPTPLDEVRQTTSQDDPKLKTYTSDAIDKVREAVQAQIDKTAEALRSALANELAQGMLQLEQGQKRLVIRIEERGSFTSGSSELSPTFVDMVQRIGISLGRIPGEVSVEGHTDEIPIRTARFQSNWDLSAARAASVANAVLTSGGLEAARLRVQGHADTRPRVPNDSPANRATNRRVEIVLDLSDPVQAFEEDVLQLLELGRPDAIPQLSWR
jgi:chemotaxis protein MotB